MPITNVKIFPPVGIARLGNSTTEYFIGPERPGDRPIPAGGYRDSACRIKRQAARFRLYGYDGATLVEELTEANTTAIEWMVHLAAKKASHTRFVGLGTGSLRNPSVADRSSLEIDPGPRTLTGPEQEAAFNTGRFLGVPVPLGEMRTDGDCRLVVLGGFGRSGSPVGAPITDYANNDGWYDDVSDGPVTARVTLSGGAVLTASPAWVICPPPDFAPPIDSITTLYDVLFQVAVDQGWVSVPATPSFTADVYPILQRILDIRRTNLSAASAHAWFATAFGPGAPASARNSIFNRVRDPHNPSAPGGANMPLLWDDNHDALQTITKTQYAVLKKWRDGTFLDDWPGSPPAPAASITPDGLTRAALEACTGAGLYPGIEGSWFLRDTYGYSEPFRLDHTGRVAGDVTKQMAVPWQADFHDCYFYGTAAHPGGLAWWPAQRPDDVVPEGAAGSVPWIREIVADRTDMVNHWQKLGFVVSKAGQLVETERRKVCSHLAIITDRSEYSSDEVAGALSGGSPAAFASSFYVIADGFLPSELGITSATPSAAQLAAWAPTITLSRQGGPITQMTARATAMMVEDAALAAGQRQRFTFAYQVEFTGTSDFMVGMTSPESQSVTLTATKGGWTAAGVLRLVNQPNPYMLDGPTTWVSTDLRVFQIKEGEARFGITMGADAGAAVGFIGNVVAHFNAQPAAGHPFDGLATDQAASRLELAEKVGGKRVFNFAVARVRYRAQATPADDVRVFFRLFTTAATGLDFDDSTYARTASMTAPRALLGIQGGRVVTIPCFGVAREDTTTSQMGTAEDTLNKQDLAAAGSVETVAYFGAWLDFNQTTPRFPLNPVPPAGPWATDLKSIQELIRGMHQCLVAEVYFKDNPIPPGGTPGNSDNLAQRNLIIDESDNPGGAATRTAGHTFEVQAPRTRPVARTGDADGHGVALRGGVTEQPSVAGQPFVREPPGPEELMIRRDMLPDGSEVSLYLPDVDVASVVRIAGQLYESVRIEMTDPHTLRCLPGDITYIPLPQARKTNIPALLTVELPEGIRRGEEFNVIVQQLSGRPRQVLGSFEFAIPVSTRDALRPREVSKLSVLRHIARRLEPEDPWRPVFERYLDLVARRVRGFGADPDRVEASATGSGTDEAARPCRVRARLVSLLLGALIVAIAVHPLVAIGVAAATAIASLLWIRRCTPKQQAIWATAVIGTTTGIAATGVLRLLGAVEARGVEVLAAGAILLGMLVVLGLWRRWLRLGPEPAS